ncbi:MAG TPA: class I SAM-dependent methyltransferase [Vicinamibacterales bacterium]|nr:class I SAM-dependent methyltransferase [Vicinamibacterales bacterium]
MAKMKQLLRGLVPGALLHRYRKWRWGHTWFDFEDRPLRDVFSEIYQYNMWGRGDGRFYSGPGSDLHATAPYTAAVRAFIGEHAIASVVDVGCGDFRVGTQFLETGVRYHGVDVVPALIRHNAATYGSDRVTFSCLDATRDDLPDGDLCLVREVFQHLSNDEIRRALDNCRKFPYVVVTERIASPGRMTAPNAEHTHGPNTRSDSGSGVVLDAPPFAENVTRVLVDLDQGDGTILRTVLVDNRLY